MLLKKVPLNAKPGPDPILTEGEVKGVLDAVDARTKRGLCFTRAELGVFIRQAVEESAYTREFPATFRSLKAQAKVAKANERQDKKGAKLRIAVAEAKAAIRIAKAVAKEDKRISDAEAKEAKRIARVEAKNAKQVANAEAKELKGIAQAAAKEAKRRITTKDKRATAANAKKARHLTTIIGTETMQSTGGGHSKKSQRFDSASESRPDLELKIETFCDFHTKVDYEITF
ncbi:unnamed protein product [Phytophthora fragariaefolia]|uniref:Unnamed protein product n=1 Tax=Phytophthora fragariaefolia TaxID=1490495 RepID=A0A9W7D8U1_9STRA|nr:unnamed protein product [Phytophthora fragariaefolia]